MSKLLAVLSLFEARTLPEKQTKPPSNIVGKCQQCGRCCTFYQCPLYNGMDKECIIHSRRPVACRIWPRREDEILETECPGYKQVGL